MQRLFLIIGLLSCASIAIADDLDKLMEKIEKERREISNEIEDLGDSYHDKGDVNSLIRQFRTLDSMVEDLEELAGEDRDANAIVDDYPDDIEDLKDALAILMDIKDQQFNIDNMPDVCEHLDDEFRDEILVQVRRDPERDLIEDIAEGFSRIAKDHMQTADDLHSDIVSQGREISRFSPSHTDWRDADNALDDTSEEAADYVETIWAEAGEFCNDIADWPDHRAVTDALNIAENTDDAIEDFLRDGEQWFADQRGRDRDICTSIEVIRDAYCSRDWEPSVESELTNYDRLANAAAADFRRELEGYISEYRNDLQDRGQALVDLDYDANLLYSQMNNRYHGLQRTLGGDVLKGSNSPWNKVWRIYGLRQHEAMTNRFDCNIADISIPGTRYKPDCILLEGCQVIEFKPNTPTGLRDGEKVNDYISGLNRWLEQEWDDYQNEELPNITDRSGMRYNEEFVLQAMARGCLTNQGDAQFSGRVATYESCSKDVSFSCTPWEAR